MQEKKILYPEMCGIAGFVAALAALIFAGSALQLKYGMAGLAMTELMILAIAVLCAIGFRFDLADTFRVHCPAGRQVGGTLVIWLGFWCLTISMSMILLAFFPESFQSANTPILDFMTGVPFPLRLLVIAVMPAVCEEALFRGLVQRSMVRLPKWPRIIAVGLLFGIMHLDPVRIPITALLGVGLSLVMFKTNNILMPALFHFVHNGISTISTLFTEAASSVAESVPEVALEADMILGNSAALIGSACALGLGAPFLILAGNILLDPKRPYGPGRFRDMRAHFAAAGAAAGVFALGWVISLITIFFRAGA